MSGFARNIAQRVTGRRRRDTHREPVAPPAPAQDALQLASSTTTVPTNKPGLLTRGMDRIRRSLRFPPRKRDALAGGGGELMRGEAGGSGGGTTEAAAAGGSKPEAWTPDEASVRAGMCSFAVKYLGSVEVFESRGMHVCEGALKQLKANNKPPIKAVLYVSGDGLRLVDQKKGLIVDQTIEKVSFCAPDRHQSKGFAYICREGSSRRWMCHGFIAVNENGERLSHAVGCAFAVCLERKKKRDVDNAAAVPADAFNPCDWSSPSNGTEEASGFTRSNPAYSTFRKSMPIEERVRDPQGAILPSAATPPSSSTSDSTRLPPPSIAKPRPSANPQLFERQGSLRAPAVDAANQQFKRQFSLRAYENTPSGGGRQFTVPISSLATQTISESDEGTSALLLPELADLVPQSAPTHPMRSPPAMIAWSAPAPPQPPPQPQYVNMFAGSLSGFTPQQEISVNTIWHSTSTPPSARVAPSQPNPTASPPSTKSKADEWLASTLQASLTMSPTHSASGITSAAAGASSSASPSLSAHSASLSSAPPAYPAPPLPPAAVLASPDRPVGEALFEATESVHPSWAAAGVVGATNGHSSQTGKASFPTVFSPDQPLPPSNFPNPAPAPSPAVAVCADPFDVQWSRLALSNSGN